MFPLAIKSVFNNIPNCLLSSNNRAHFLQGSFMTWQLKKYVGQELPTLNPRVRWNINNHNGVSTFNTIALHHCH